MFDIGWSELLVLAVLAIVFIGPKDLPRVMRAAGGIVRKARRMAQEFRDSLEQMAHEVELEEVKKSIHHVSNFDPKTAVQHTIDPTGTMLEAPAATAGEGAAKAKKPRARKPATARTTAKKSTTPKPVIRKEAAKAPAARKPAARKPAAKKPTPAKSEPEA